VLVGVFKKGRNRAKGLKKKIGPIVWMGPRYFYYDVVLVRVL
jgi:hypothetical protein